MPFVLALVGLAVIAFAAKANFDAAPLGVPLGPNVAYQLQILTFPNTNTPAAAAALLARNGFTAISNVQAAGSDPITGGPLWNAQASFRGAFPRDSSGAGSFNGFRVTSSKGTPV